MQRVRSRRTSWAIAASVLAHACVLVAALLQRPHLPSPIESAGGPAPKVIPIFLMPRRSHAAPEPARAPQATRPLAALRAQAAAPLSQRSAENAPPSAPPTAQGGVTSAEGAAGGDPRLVLRRGAAGCASSAVLGMTRAERDRCDEELAAGSRTAPVLTIALDPRVRSYYDAVAKAKAPDKPLTPQRAIGALGRFDGDPRGATGHGPSVGCKIPFGPGQKPKLPTHWLTWGPCYIAPPQGPLTVEADITPP